MTEPLRVLFVPHAYAPVRGGTELLCQRVAEGLLEAGQQVRVLTTDAGAVDAYYRFGVAPVRRAPRMINGVPVVRVPFGGRLHQHLDRVLGLIPAGNTRVRVEGRAWRFVRGQLARAFRRQITVLAPDVVVTMPHLVVNVQAVLKIHRIRPCPLVILPMLHEEDPTWEAGEMRDALGRADAVVAMTAHERDRLIGAYGVPRDAVFVGGMGVDLPAGPGPVPGRRDAVVFVGRKSLRKGLPLLLDAMKRVWEHRPAVPLVMAGARTEDSGTIEDLVRRLPAALQRNVVSEDNVSEERKAEILDRAVCLVLPSRIESFGGVILEAWARRTPAIGLDLPVFREIIETGVDGLLARVDDAPALASAIQWCLDHPEAAEAMGEAGRARAEQAHTWRAVSLRHLAAYRYAVARFGQRHGATSATASGAPVRSHP